MKPWRKGLHMLEGLLHSRRIPDVPVPTGPLPITPEWQRRHIEDEQAEHQRRLDALLADANVFRQEHHDHA